jgi:hypothetical protein
MPTDVLEEHIALQETSSPPAFTLVSCLAYFSTLKMEAKWFSETSVGFQWTTQPYIPEDGTFHNHHCENLKSYSYIGATYSVPFTEYAKQRELISQFC